jgi:hypothetical protein
MPVSVALLSMRGLPPLGFGGSSGSSGSIASQSSSVTSALAIASPYPIPSFVRRIKKKSKGQGLGSPVFVNPHLGPEKATITSYKGGSSSTLEFPKKESKVPRCKRIGGGTRKVATGLSSSARLRFLRKMATVDFFQIKGRALFVTLTYPKNKCSSDPDWKTNLQNFRKRLQRKYSEVKGFWRLELSGKDGSLRPHFHLLLILNQRISNKALADIRAFVASAWYEVCGMISDDHLLAGTQDQGEIADGLVAPNKVHREKRKAYG